MITASNICPNCGELYSTHQSGCKIKMSDKHREFLLTYSGDYWFENDQTYSGDPDKEYHVIEYQALVEEKHKIADLIHELRLMQIYFATKEKYLHNSLIPVSEKVDMLIKKYGDL